MCIGVCSLASHSWSLLFIIQPQEDKGQELAKKQQHPKKGQKGEHEHMEFGEQFPASSVEPARSKVAAQQFPLSHETLTTSQKRPMLVPASPTLQASGTVWTNIVYC